MSNPYAILGITDDITTCDCCGKTNLKRTVALDRDGDTVYFGVDCAARAMRRPATTVRKVARAAQSEREYAATRRARCAKTLAWLDQQIEAHGTAPIGNLVHRLTLDGVEPAMHISANSSAIAAHWMVDGRNFGVAARRMLAHLATA